jgi:hypothetical protein
VGRSRWQVGQEQVAGTVFLRNRKGDRGAEKGTSAARAFGELSQEALDVAQGRAGRGGAVVQ